MKVLNKILFTGLFFLLNIVNVFAENPPPPETTGGRAAARKPSPVDMGFDENIVFLLILALIFGIYIVYYKNKKASI